MTLSKNSILLAIWCLISVSSIASIDPFNDIIYPTVVKKSINKINGNVNPQGIQKIVIDAGHGGKDLGCRGHHSIEKNIVLSIAKKLGSMIRYAHPEIEVIYTRETDVFIPLFRRIEMANQNNADLFISLHCNHFDGSKTHGSETYVMGLHTADENLAVAKRENASVLYEADFKSTYGGFDPSSPETHIILSAIQNLYLDKSIELADRIENSFAKRTLLRSRGVKQAGFVVLRRATMPSVLIETGFLSNQKNEAYLSSDEGQESVARAITIALSEYKKDLAEVLVQVQNKPILHASNSPPVTQSLALVDRQNTRQETSKVEKTKSPDKTVVKNKVIPASSFKSKHQLIFRVQIAASVNKPLSKKTIQWKKISDLDIRQESNMYKYLTGSFKHFEEALAYRKEMLHIGFEGAFVVGYLGETRVKI